MSNHHVLKIHPKPLADLLSGAKTCEVRFNDRGFQVGDTVALQEINPQTEELIGKPGYVRVITHVQQGYGLPEHLCVISYAPPAAAPVAAGEPAAWECVHKGYLSLSYEKEGDPERAVPLFRAAPPAAAHGDEAGLPGRLPNTEGTWGDMGDAYSAGWNDCLDQVAAMRAQEAGRG